MQTIKIPSTDINVAVLNDTCRWRAETLWTKEPATVGWLGGLGPDDTLWDVGANIGLYSLFAAARGARVVAFEPMIPNLFAIWENLRLNVEIARNITICPVALTNTDGFNVLNLSSMHIGSSCHSAGTTTNFRGEHKDTWQGRHGTWLIRAEMMPFPYPTAVKIDVDGLEHCVVEGFGPAENSLMRTVKTWCIETNPAVDGHRDMVRQLEAAGFEHDPLQFAAAQRRDGPFKDVGEMIWHRG